MFVSPSSSSKSNAACTGQPDLQYPTEPINSFPSYRLRYQHPYTFMHDALANSQRSFRGIGPSVAWSASARFGNHPTRRDNARLGHKCRSSIRAAKGERTSANHSQNYYEKNWQIGPGNFFRSNTIKQGFFEAAGLFTAQGALQAVSHHTNSATFNRMRTVVVPNLGGYCGAFLPLFQCESQLRLSRGFLLWRYGWRHRYAKSENRGFFGPFATISIGFP